MPSPSIKVRKLPNWREAAMTKIALPGWMGTAIVRPVFAGSGKFYVQVRQVEAAFASCHRGAGARAAPFLPLRHGADRRADPSAAGRCRHRLERGRTLQHLADAPGASREEGGCRRPRHAA